MYYNWVEDQNDKVDILKNLGILVGSFFNPEAAKQMSENPNGTFKSTDKEFEQSTKMVMDSIKKEANDNPVRKRKRKIIKE